MMKIALGAGQYRVIIDASCDLSALLTHVPLYTYDAADHPSAVVVLPDSHDRDTHDDTTTTS